MSTEKMMEQIQLSVTEGPSPHKLTFKEEKHTQGRLEDWIYACVCGKMLLASDAECHSITDSS